MKHIILSFLLVSSITSCVSNRLKIKVDDTNTKKVIILPYEEYIYSGVKLMNASDTLYLDPLFTVKVK